MSKVCITHHDACDCREAEFAILKEKLAKCELQLKVAKDAQMRTYDGLTEKVEKYRKALEFYAEGNHIKWPDNEAAEARCVDYGATAEEALEED